MMPLIESFGMSDIGLSRPNNEDMWGELPDDRFYALADGMGGHLAGEVAAKEAVLRFCDSMEKFFRYNPEPTVDAAKSCLKDAFQETNRWIRKFGADYPTLRGMGTTLSCLLVLNQQLVYAHIGDSRIYRFRKRLERLTRDHSLCEELVMKGKLDEEEVFTYPRKNILTRALGIAPTIEPEIQETTFQAGDLYFLCSDGLHDPLSDNQIEFTLSRFHTLKEKSIGLVEAAKSAGGGDNITVLMIRSLN